MEREALRDGLRRRKRVCYSEPARGLRMGVGPDYILIDGKTFKEEPLTLDNHVFKNCTIDLCRIYYSGGPFELIDTHITNSTLILNQPAKNIYSAIQIFKMKSPGSKIVAD